MRVLVRRKWFTPHSTMGEMLIDGKFAYYTLEPTTRHSEKPYAIPFGTYDLTIRHSDRFKRLMPYVENVPGFEGILIHWGNYPRDTEGCLLIGVTRGPTEDFIGESRLAFDDFFHQIQAAIGEHVISYVNGDINV